MGRSIAAVALADSVCVVRGALEVSGHKAIGHDYGVLLGQTSPMGVPVVDEARQAIRTGDVVIEFTQPEATVSHVQLAKELGKAMVIGTTGMSDEQLGVIRAAAQSIPIVLAPNMSPGMTTLFELARIAARHLGSSYDVEIVESHHRYKKDAPSGTAKQLAAVLAKARNQPVSSIPVHAVRAGDIVGDHTVILAGPSERIELTHRAQSRDVFAQGAIRAAQFVHGKPAGLYGMLDVLR